MYEKFKDLLRQGQENEKMREKLNTIGTVFFFHLAGVDTEGHRFGYDSDQYPFVMFLFLTI